MSLAALSEASGVVLATWETEGQVYFVRIDAKTGKSDPPIAASGKGTGRKYAVVAANVRGETILVWTEGMGWNLGGSLGWQVFAVATVLVLTALAEVARARTVARSPAKRFVPTNARWKKAI